MKIGVLRILFTGMFAFCLVSQGHTQSVEEFYRGRTVTVVIGYAAGGGFDLYARLLTRHMGRHIPGKPTLLPQNMPGAGSLKAANYLYNVAPKDGSTFGAIGRSIPLAPLLGTPNAEFDALAFNWLGSAAKEELVAVSWHTSPVKTLEDATRMELIVGSDSAASETTQIPRLFNATLGTKFKIITGYSIPQIALGMERGELGGQIGWSLDSLLVGHSDWIRDKKINILAQTGFKPDPRLSGVPLAIDHTHNEADRQLLALIFDMEDIARPIVAPPGVPAERIKALSSAFMETVRDSEYLADAARSSFNIQPSSADETTALIRSAYTTPVKVVDRAKDIFSEAQ